MSRPELVAAVRAHARKHYERGGWDILIECWEDSDIEDAMGASTTEAGAIRTCAKVLGIMDDYRTDIQATAF
jgi:hypothetical protein